MGKFKPIRYNNGKEIFRVKIEDTTGAFLENWVFMKDDFERWAKLMKRKFGISDDKPKEIDKDLDWAN